MRRHPWLGVAGLVAATGLTSCVYFNTFYNAEKYYRQAEKARAEYEAQVAAGAPRARAGPYIDLYDKAVRKASIVLEKYPDSDLIDDAMFLAGRALYWQGDYQYAMRSFHDLEVNFPKSEFLDRARLWRGRALLALGRKGEARVLFGALVSEGSPVGDRAGLRLAELDQSEGDDRGAIADYRDVLVAYPKTPLASQMWLRIGQAYARLGNPAHLDSALLAFERAVVGASPDSVRYRARLDRGRVLYVLGREGEALDTYRGLLGESRFREWEGETRILLGRTYRERGEFDLALREFERVRDDFPQTSVSAMALYETGRLYLQGHGERRRAEEYFAEVSQEQRGSPADSLAREMLQTGAELDALMEAIWTADSTAAAIELPADAADTKAADSLSTATPPTAPWAPPADLPENLKGYRVGVDDQGGWQPLVPRPARGDDAADPPRRPNSGQRRRRRPVGGAAESSLERQLFSVAEVYRDRLEMPDSAAVFYAALVEHFPDSPERPRALYSLAWILHAVTGDTAAARPYLRQLVAEYGTTAHANAARHLLGLPPVPTAEEAARSRFRQLELERPAAAAAMSLWIDRLDSLSRAYPGTATAARAAFVAAWATENDLGDSAAAVSRFDSVATRYPKSEFADLVRRRHQAQLEGVVAKMERELRTLGRGLRPEERLTLIAVEPDSVDSVSLARQHLGFALRAHRRGRYERAAELYRASLDAQQGGNGNALAGLGDVNWRQAYFEEAVDQMRAAIKARATSLLPYYRLFRYHVMESRVDSANHYLRLLARRGRKDPAVLDVVSLYPTIASAEPENLDLEVLEGLDLEPDSGSLELQPGFFGVQEPPMVRSLRAVVYPEGETDSTQVVLDVLVAGDGIPEQVEVFEGDEPFATAACTAVEGYRFYPAMDRRQRPLDVWVELEIPLVPPVAARAEATEADGAAHVAHGPPEPPTPGAMQTE